MPSGKNPAESAQFIYGQFLRKKEKVDFLQNINWGIVLIQFAVLLFSLSIHEAAHAWMADRRGDYTARYMGRVSLNPAAHIDPIGTVVFPLLNMIGGFPLIGWAKPIPVNPMHLKDPARDHMYISIAGPVSNLIAGTGAFVLLLMMKWSIPGAGINYVAFTMRFTGSPIMTPWGMLLPPEQSIIAPIVAILFFMMLINFMLAVFNLLPVPPLDGHWIVAGLLPPAAAESFQRLGAYGIFILYGLMFLGVLRHILYPVINTLRTLLIQL